WQVARPAEGSGAELDHHHGRDGPHVIQPHVLTQRAELHGPAPDLAAHRFSSHERCAKPRDRISSVDPRTSASHPNDASQHACTRSRLAPSAREVAGACSQLVNFGSMNTHLTERHGRHSSHDACTTMASAHDASLESSNTEVVVHERVQTPDRE